VTFSISLSYFLFGFALSIETLGDLLTNGAFFSFFHFHLLEGGRMTPMDEKNDFVSIVVTPVDFIARSFFFF
jgi:hypothetical protein